MFILMSTVKSLYGGLLTDFIKTMVQQNTPCPDVLLQIAAVRGALDKVARIVLDEHLTECIGRAAQEGNIESEIAQLKAALDRFLP
jgi:CsoR family transcriptional regulator, copper-sensing transcriptional repressor